MHNFDRPDSTSGKTFASGAEGMGFISRADQISHTLPTTRHRCNLDCMGLGADLIFLILMQTLTC